MSQITTAADGSDAQSPMTTSEHHYLLASEQRRAVLRRLSEFSAVTVSNLAEEVVEADDVERTDASARDAVEAQLHHRHLPMLDEAGLVDYDTDANRVERTVKASDLPTA